MRKIAMMLMVMAMGCGGPNPTEFDINGSFERRGPDGMPEGWAMTYGVWGVDAMLTPDASDGRWALRLDQPHLLPVGLSMGTLGGIIDCLKIEAAYKDDAPGGQPPASLLVRWRADDGSYLDVSRCDMAAPNPWAKQACMAVAPGAASAASLEIARAAATGAVLVDGIRVWGCE